VRYTYDGLGRRITRNGPGGFEEYLYDGDQTPDIPAPSAVTPR
jgi:hypothetical protein